jgi:hypothetical protein
VQASTFSLIPFENSEKFSGVLLSLDFSVTSHNLVFKYSLVDPNREYVSQENLKEDLSEKGMEFRKNELWKDTCFELFWGLRGSESYYELNFSPDGRWNIYHFDSYRRGMKEEVKIQSLALSKRVGNPVSIYEVRLPLTLFQLGPIKKYQLSGTAVLRDKADRCSYWAISHQDEKPNFHLRSSFVVSLNIG